METKQIVRYVSYAVSAIALVSLFGSAPLQVLILAACAAVNVFYVGK